MENLSVYYDSLKLVYDELSAWKPPKLPLINSLLEKVEGFLIGLLLACIIPLLPLLLMLLGSIFPITIGLINTGDGTFKSFGLLWTIAVALAASLYFGVSRLKGRLELQAPTNRPRQSLSPNQLDFLAAHEATKELQIYFVSHIDQHVDNSLRAISRISRSKQFTPEFVYTDKEGRIIRQTQYGDMVFPDIAEKSSTRPSFPKLTTVAGQFLNLTRHNTWIELSGDSKEILTAIKDFSSKIPPRLRRRENLPEVLSVLQSMSRFFYCFLPEHTTNMDAQELDALRAEGFSHAKNFASAVISLSVITFTPKPRIAEEGISISKKLAIFYIRNIFFRFIVWFFTLFLLSALSMYLFSFFFTISPDTIASIVIGASVAGAAALAALLPRKVEGETSKKDDLSMQADSNE